MDSRKNWVLDMLRAGETPRAIHEASLAAERAASPPCTVCGTGTPWRHLIGGLMVRICPACVARRQAAGEA